MVKLTWVNTISMRVIIVTSKTEIAFFIINNNQSNDNVNVDNKSSSWIKIKISIKVDINTIIDANLYLLLFIFFNNFFSINKINSIIDGSQ